LALTVVVIYLKTTMRRKSDGLNQTLRTIARSRLRRGDLPAIRSDRELVICLTHTSATQAEVVIERLRQAFEPFGVTIGAATMPDDARDPLNLLLIAEHRAKGAAGQILYA
jgi:GGDEF domain-containing protein